VAGTLVETNAFCFFDLRFTMAGIKFYSLGKSNTTEITALETK